MLKITESKSVIKEILQSNITSELDFNANSKLEKLDEITLKYDGRFYLAKDARMKKEVFKKSDERIREYISFRNKNDCKKNFISAQSSRLEL